MTKEELALLERRVRDEYEPIRDAL